jgi:hypothetical protein
VASSRLSIGDRKTGFEERQAAMVKTGSRDWKMVASISICGSPELLEDASQQDSFDSLFQDGGREEAQPRECQRDGQGLVLLPLSYHVPAKGGQTAVLIESSKFFKNRERLVHGHDIRWVNSTTQEFLQSEVRTRSSNYQSNASNLDVFILPRSLHCQTNAL